MGETFNEFCKKLKTLFKNKVYIHNKNNNEPVDYYVRDIKIEGDYLYLDGKKINLSNYNNTGNIIIINGSIETISNCKNVFVSENVSFIQNADSVICNDIDGHVLAENITANDINGNVEGTVITCKNVSGDVNAQGSVKCEDVLSAVISSGDIEVKGDVNGNVSGKDVSIKGDINGKVVCNGDLTIKGNINGDYYETIEK